MCVSHALATPCDCRQEHSEWDKLFIMLENSQMREGMLLQATDDVLRGELQRLRADLGRLAGGMARPCAAGGPADARLARALEPLLQESRDASRRLARLEDAEARRPQAAVPGLGAVLEELQRTRADLSAVQSWVARRWLPAGKRRAQNPPSALSLESAALNHIRHALVGTLKIPRALEFFICTLTELSHTTQDRHIASKKYFSARGNKRRRGFNHQSGSRRQRFLIPDTTRY